MRYRKGSISVSSTLDVPLLLLIRNSRFITPRQLCILAGYNASPARQGNFRWRIGRLVRSGLVGVLGQDMDGERVYVLTELGFERLYLLGNILLSIGYDDVCLKDDHETRRALQLTEVRLKLASYGIVKTWLTSPEVSEANRDSDGGYAADYDAVTNLVLNGQLVSMGIVQDRKLSGAVPEEFRSTALRENSLDLILYLTEDTGRVCWAEKQLAGVHPFLLVAPTRFVRDYGLDAMLHTATDTDTLEGMLQKSAAHRQRVQGGAGHVRN